MQQTPGNSDASVRASGRSPGHTGETPHGRTRTAAAAQEFFRAVGSDLAALAHRLRQNRLAKRAQAAHATPSPNRRGSFARATAVVLRRFAIAMVGLVALAMVGALAISGAMLWAIHDMPLERPSDAAKPALLLETA